ncbi:MAG: PAS domain S-box protein [Candidatus Aminicenantes bacterium]|nr:MAG: PAS domain S-box protein [Candidatus Aminicenantes bacterium]
MSGRTRKRTRTNGTSPIHILLVEDNPDDALIIREMLSETVSTQYQVQWVDQVSRGKQQLEENIAGVDLVLLDLFLPDSRGMDTLLNFKTFTPRIPIVVLTGLDNKEMGRCAIKEGAQDYICKNDLTPSMLENSLRFAIERHQLIMQLEKRKNQTRKSEQRFRRIIERSADGILILDQEGRIIFTNPAAEKILGKTPDELIGQKFGYTLVPGEAAELNITGEPGGVGFVEMRVKKIDWEGKTAYLASLWDISERKQLEKSLLVEKERLDITFRSIGDGVITTDEKGCIESVNQAGQQMIGRTQHQVSGQPVSRILDLEFPPQSPQKNKRAFSYGTSVITVKDNEIVIDYSHAPILDKEDYIIGYVFIIRDTTLQKKMIEEMIKTRKLESLGVVAGKLAHDYDNVFTIILGNISIAKTHLAEDQEVFKMLEKSEKSALRAMKLTNQLHTFSKAGCFYQRSISITRLLKNVVEDILEERGPVDSPITCAWNIPADLWPVEFDRDQIYTAVWNIVKNAEESMPNGGLLEIILENVLISEKMHLPLKSGSYVKVSIKDHGSGMEKAALQKIFDPFFTTKEATGMGLATAFSIIRNHQGTIEVQSEKGVGSNFIIFLPAAADREGRWKMRSEKVR